MANIFEDNLNDILVNNEMDIPYSKQLEKFYRQMIAFGVWGEIGNNYYLFIYRNTFHKNLKYEAVVFIHTPFDLEKSIQLIITDQYSDQRRLENFISAAIYFLKKKIPNTLVLSKDSQGLYNQLKKTIQGYNNTENSKRIEFEKFDFNIRGQEIKINEIPLKKPANRSGNSYILRNMQLLKSSAKNKNESTFKKNCSAKQFRLGLCLELSDYNFKKNHFLPVIVPIKKNGDHGAAKIIQPFQWENYNFAESPELLKEYIENLHRFNWRWGVNTSNRDVLYNLYFEKIAHLFIEMPDDLTFCRNRGIFQKNFLSLTKITFKKIDVKFIPSVDGENLQIFLEVTASDGRIFQPGLKFQIVINDENYNYLFFCISDFQSGSINIDSDKEGNFKAYFAAPEEPGKIVPFFRFLAEITTISVNDFKDVQEALREIASDALEVHLDPLPLYHLEYHPTPVLMILDERKSLKVPKRIEITFDYNSGLKDFLGPDIYPIQAHFERNTHFENMCFLLLKTDPLLRMRIDQKNNKRWNVNPNLGKFFFTIQDNDESRWLVERGNIYLEKGFKIYYTKQKKYIDNCTSNLHMIIYAGVKWLEFKPKLQNVVTGEITDLDLDEVNFYTHIVNDSNGKLYLLKKEDLEKLARLYKYTERHGDIFRIPSGNYFLINEFYDKRMEKIPNLKEKLHSAKKLESFKQMPTYKLAQHFNGELRKYQQAGFQWLHFLWEYKLSGCLADDMGLGKTIQTLALLQTLKERKKLSPSLLIVPVSAIPNWEAEIQKFTPGLTVYRHMGNIRAKDFNEWCEYDLMITSYATLRNDIEIFKEFKFDYIILDESQNIKNLASQTSMAVKVLKGNHRLALSGTPIENNTMELWSLFDFLLPGFLGTHTWFKKQWALPVEKDKDKEKNELLKKMIYPFILRRKKEQVEKELPAKTEIVQSLQMEEKQMKLYAAFATYYRNLIDKEIAEKGLEKSSFKILEGMLRLRQICLFPHLVDEKFKDVPTIKFEYFSNLLEDILSVGHKVLVFSQFVKVLSILKNHLDSRTVKYAYIDGSITLKDREKNVKDFQEKEDTQVFLLSLKAGGVALNLTAADYVVIFDPWWNPAVETQAIDRSHRIGQTKKVIVYRMVVKDTIEEKMLVLKDQKKELVDQLITSEAKTFKNLTREDIIDLFKF